jgi:YidC/Oxa1 family membrane protein insertase
VEKRALIAFLLMFLVLVGHMLLTSRARRQAPTETAEPEITREAAPPEEVTDRPDTVSSESLPVIGMPTGEAPVKQVVVVTPLFTARFSSIGGVIESFRLHEYLSDGETPVELVPEAARHPLGVVLIMDGDRRMDLSGNTWTVSSDSLGLERGSEASLIFGLETEGGLRITKTCVFRGDTYLFDVDIRVTGTGSNLVRGIEMGWDSGLSVTETHREKDDLSSFASLTLTSTGMEKTDRGDVKDRQDVLVSGDIRWAGLKTKYFLAAVIPEAPVEAVSRSFRAAEDAIGVTLETARPGAGSQGFAIYAGPLDYQRLKALGHGLDKAVDFGWSWISPLSRLVFRFMLLVNKVIPNYGVVIIILSALTKLLFWPLTQKSFKSMREMQKIQPAMAELKEKYKNDPQKLNKAMMELYRERGINPLGGCFPMLLQMPVFIALFNVLRTTIELRRAPFLLWIDDLSSPDVVANMPFSLPFIGSTLSLLPILMGVAMFIQQKMQSTDPKQAALTYMMPIVFTFLFFRFPSGLVLYWLVNNILTIGHQYLMNRADRAQEALTTGG